MDLGEIKFVMVGIGVQGIKGPNKKLRWYREVYIGMVVSLCQGGIIWQFKTHQFNNSFEIKFQLG